MVVFKIEFIKRSVTKMLLLSAIKVKDMVKNENLEEMKF